LLFEDALEALKTAGAEMAALDLIHEEQQFMVVAEPAQAAQIFR
jgi:hypothetical protein